MWTMSSVRIRGSQYEAPHVNFYIGALKIACIVMDGYGAKRRFLLKTYDGKVYLEDFATFSEALIELHKLLNSPPPEG